MAELQQHVSTAVGVGPRVKQHERPLVGGHQRRQRRPGHPLDPLDDEGTAHDERPGAAGRYKRVPFPSCQLAHAFGHGAVLMFLEDGLGLVLHAYHVGRVHNLHTGQGDVLVRRHPADFLFPSHQDDGVSVLRDRHGRPFDNLQRRVVPAERIHNDPHTFSSFPIYLSSPPAGPAPAAPARRIAAACPVSSLRAAAESRNLPPWAGNPPSSRR